MKSILLTGCLFVFIHAALATERTYMASTPGGAVVKLFLGIPLPDSIDFIRWKIILTDKNYTLSCQYGISKPNTNGFINEGKKIEYSGKLTTAGHYIQLQHAGSILQVMAFNTNLLHILDADKQLLVGNGGWSYTLNNVQPTADDELYVLAKQTALPDSMAFEGRTPCGVSGPDGLSADCYKLKWYFVLYADAKNNAPATYKMMGASPRKKGRATGSWQVLTGTDGRIIYRLNDEQGNEFLYLVKASNQILLFADAAGKPLAGNEDFSYTLNSRVMGKINR